jgi:hypothetical protein
MVGIENEKKTVLFFMKLQSNNRTVIELCNVRGISEKWK